MRLRRYHIGIIFGGLVLLGVIAPFQDVFAQERRGTAGAAHLRVTPTAHLTSIGSAGTAGVAGLSGVEMLFTNPAGMTLNEGTGVVFGHVNYLVETDINTLALVQQIGGSNQLGLFISAWDLGDIHRQTELNPEISELTFSPSIATVGVSYARQFTDRIAAGVTVKLVNQDIDDMTATAAAFDGGLTYAVTGTGLRFGISLRNIGSKITFSGRGLSRETDIPEQGSDADLSTLYIESEPMDFPTLLNAGVSYERPIGESLSFSVLANFRSNSFDQDQYSGGLELGFLDIFYIRGGLELAPDQDLTLFGPGSFGAGLDLELSGLGLVFDYAFRPTDYFSAVQLFTLDISI